MKDFLQVADQYYVLASSVLADRETRVLKQGETFAIFDQYGDIQPVTHPEAGIFYEGMRHLSSLNLSIADDDRPLLLNSVLRDDNGVLKVEMTNPDLLLPASGFLAKGTLHIHREKFVLDSSCHERLTVANFGAMPIQLPARLRLAADYADTFEVRGMKRAARGRLSEWTRHGSEARITYLGLDGMKRTTSVRMVDTKFDLIQDRMEFELEIPAHSTVSLYFVISFQGGDEQTPTPPHEDGLKIIVRNHKAGRRHYCQIRTSNDQFDAWLRRSTDDLVMMSTLTTLAFDYPYAGIPWYCTPFGRDGLITALECLWANPDMARGVLAFCAATQSNNFDPERDATPGKIFHEFRSGEMANLNEVPFGRYYGSIDSTPLFLALCGAYYQRTGDIEFIRELWPQIEAALTWVDVYGDPDEDGFVEYKPETPRGLAHQGWKDSHDAVFHADGSDAVGPIALCEVQGYVYMAKNELAPAAIALGHKELALRLKHEAQELRERFNKIFWLDDLGTYALALDGDKRACAVVSSNAAQCLFTGIVPDDRAASVVAKMFAPSSFSGWGVRTIDAGYRRYNPMSYHNGSVWPHDNALIAWGLDRYGFKVESERIFDGLFRAATYMDLQRMPEVFCGFERREGEAPTLYHHACAPQAWAAGAIYLCLQASLGLSVDAVRKRISFQRPRLPAFLEYLRISDLVVGHAKIDLQIQNYGNDVSVQILNRDGNVTVSVEK